MIVSNIYQLIDQTFEFELNGVKKQTNILAGEPDKKGNLWVYVETKDSTGKVDRKWVDYRFFESWMSRAVA